MKNLTVFSRKDIKKRIRNFSFTKIKNKDDKTYRIGNWIKNIESGKILMQKEEELQSLFLHTFFGEVLSYDYQNPNNWNLMEEAKMKFDATKSDGALGFFSIDENKNIKRDIRAVIELKNARTVLDKKQNRKDFKGSSVEQAFMYATKIGKTCKWVIISNFLEIRLYHANDINKYEYFDILELGKKEEFERFYFLMANGQLFLEKQNSIIENALEERIEKEKKITLEFYAHYKTLRELFVHHLISHNKNISPLKLISLAQKIIDRIVFISVVKDYGLLSYNIVRMLERTASYSFAMDGEELWRQLKHLFNAMDKGFSPRVLQFNGGLYKDNLEINNLKIKDFFLYKLLKLSSYDFESDLNINILGHIFENSISDIEDLKNSFLNKKIEVLDENIDQLIKKNVTKEIGHRKEHGIFYTPEYITKYMVENTIEKWLNEKKKEIAFDEIKEIPSDFASLNNILILLKKYQLILKSISILDPSCGSGAFLTQAYNFLKKEWDIIFDIYQKIKKIISEKGYKNLTFEIIKDWKIGKFILKNNLFGVDLNMESVEISKLGLWLKTATQEDTLAILENNIKCGNSLIDDEKIAKEKAFNWNKEFPKIMKNGGFDIIIGNPPYLSFQNKFFNEEEIKFFKKNYKKVYKIYDAFALFIEKAIFLLQKHGSLTYIIPTVLLNNFSFYKLRELIVKETNIERIVLLDDGVFKDAVVSTIILSLEKNKIKDKIKIFKKDKDNNFILNKIIDNELIIKLASDGFNVNLSKENINLLSKVHKNKTLISDVLNIMETIKTGNNSLYIVDNKKDNNHFPVLMGKDIGRYKCFSKKFINFNHEKLSRPIKKEYFYNEKLFIRRVANEIIACYDNENHFSTHVLYLAISKDKKFSLKYLLCLLNSKFFSYLYKIKYPFKGKIFPEIRIGNLRKLAVPKLALEKQKPFILKSELMISLNKEKNEEIKDFLETLKEEKNIFLKTGKNLRNFWKFNFSQLKDELQKQKIKFSIGKENKEWRNYFLKTSKKIINLENEIYNLNEEIDKMVYKIYKLTKSEIEFLKNFNE